MKRKMSHAPTQDSSRVTTTHMVQYVMYKNRLQEYTQDSLIPFPMYKTLCEGPQHLPRFRSTVLVNGQSFTSPVFFPNRKAAEQDAARLALQSLHVVSPQSVQLDCNVEETSQTLVSMNAVSAENLAVSNVVVDSGEKMIKRKGSIVDRVSNVYSTLSKAGPSRLGDNIVGTDRPCSKKIWLDHVSTEINHEDMKLQLISDFEKEYAELCIKYTIKFQEIGVEFQQTMKNTVLMNKLSPDAFRAKCMVLKPSAALGIQHDAGAAHQLPQHSRQRGATHPSMVAGPSSCAAHIHVDSVSSFEGNSVSAKVLSSPLRVPPCPLRVPPCPHRVPPSPSRFSMSPKLGKLDSLQLNLTQVVRATRNFSESLQIGEGGFGTVYKAELEDGVVVAVKRAKREQLESLRAEFRIEVEFLAKIEHRNLVKLLGYIDKENERILITEFVPNGTLREHLDGLRGRILDFNQRLEIAIDVAHGLTYLHQYAEKQIIHRDVKSSNILLTESMRAKVADFGFAKLGPMNSDQTHISTKVKGTVGYLDPEYMKTNQLTTKSDVYSFGILLLEIVTGRRPVDLKKTMDESVTLIWAFMKFNELVDPLMEEAMNRDVGMKIFDLAFQCAAPVRADRPDMKSVVEKLLTIRAYYQGENNYSEI